MLERVYSKRDARSQWYPFCKYLLVHRRGRIVHSFKFKTINNFSSINRMKFITDAE